MTEAAREWVVTLPYPGPPLTANQRHHWRAHHRIRAKLLDDARWLIRAQRIPPLGRCRVELHWSPPDRRRRDADNLVPTLKVCADAAMHEGIVGDDTPDLMVKLMPTIEAPCRPPRLWLVITALP